MGIISKKVADAQDLTEMDYEVPEWGVTLRLVSPTVKVRLAMVEQYTEWETDVDGRSVGILQRDRMSPALVIACAHDPETGEQAFEESDLEMLQGKNGKVVEAVAKACWPLVGFGEDGATESGKDDSSTTPSDGSESDSLSGSAAP